MFKANIVECSDELCEQRFLYLNRCKEHEHFWVVAGMGNVADLFKKTERIYNLTS